MTKAITCGGEKNILQVPTVNKDVIEKRKK